MESVSMVLYILSSVNCAVCHHFHPLCRNREGGKNCRTTYPHRKIITGESCIFKSPWWAGDTASTWCGAGSASHRSASSCTARRCTCKHPSWNPRQETTLKRMNANIYHLSFSSFSRYMVGLWSTEVHRRFCRFFIPGRGGFILARIKLLKSNIAPALAVHQFSPHFLSNCVMVVDLNW